jgi:hypothetical protein
MKNQIFAILSISLMLISALFINVGNASLQTTVTLQSNGTIIQENPSPVTVILRNTGVFSGSVSSINAQVDSFVSSHSYATAVTISDMHQYGIWWYGYTFNKNNGTWMGVTFAQLKTMIDRFHYNGWKVGLETTGVAWNGQEEYNYIESKHPELAFINANGASAAVTYAGTNNLIPDFFAKFATPDTINNIPVGTRLIDLYSTRLTQMIKDGLQWDFWFGTDGWNGFNMQGYYWNTQTADQCYSFSAQEENEFAGWSGATLPLNWASMSQTQKANAIITNQTILNNWWFYWQTRFAQMYLQIKQAFLNAGEPASDFHVIGSADVSSEPGGSGNLGPVGMYNMSLLAQYGSVDYFYVDQEGTAYNKATYALGREQAYVGALVKMQNPSLNPIIGLQPVDWLGNRFPLWEVEQEYLSQAVNYVWYNGIRYQVSAPNIIMMQYPNATGWAGWSASDMNSLFTFINSTIALLQNANPVWLGPTYALSDAHSGSFGMAWWGMNYSIAQWIPTTNLANNPQYLNSSMGTLLLDEALGDAGGSLNGTTVIQQWANGSLNVWFIQDVGMDWDMTRVLSASESQINSAFHIINNMGNSANYTIINPQFGYSGSNFIVNSPANQYLAHGSYIASQGFTSIANYTYDSPNRIGIGYYYNATTGKFLYTAFPSVSQNQQSSLPRDMINNMLYWVSDCPITSSESLIDLKVFNNLGTIVVPMTNQKDVGNSFVINNSLYTTLNINANALSLGSPSQYTMYWQSNPSNRWTPTSWNNIAVTLNGGADVLVISPM